VLLVGGASRRFGAPKALARLDGETLAERAWRTLGEACDERIAVGKAADSLPLPFPVVDDGCDVRAPIAGVVAGLRAAAHDLCVFLPVDCPFLTADTVRLLAAEAPSSVPTGPLPGAYTRDVLPMLEGKLARGDYTLRDLDATVVAVGAGELVNVNTRAELDAVQPRSSGSTRSLRPHAPLEGRIVRVEPIAERHREGLRDAAEREPQIHRFTAMYLLGFDRWFDEAVSSETEVPFVVHVDGRPVGSTRYMNIEPFHRRTEIGWTWLERPQWGTGANIETKYLLLRHAFEDWGAMRVEFKTDARNLRVRGALLGIGATFEGIFRKHMVLPDSIRDSAWYAIVDDDWPRVKELLERKIERHAKAARAAGR
jgi:molybdopterin-guanine dinucleotide biosynthesis protein A/RimJ/RimL family protein N-acetyltransferase